MDNVYFKKNLLFAVFKYSYKNDLCIQSQANSKDLYIRSYITLTFAYN